MPARSDSQDAAAAPLLLMTPGPTRVPERVLRAGSRPMIHHRTPEFSRELSTSLALLAPVVGTRHTPLPIHTTGRGALEAAICNLFSPGDEIAMCCNGKFGEMWAGFAESYGLHVHRWSTEWERDADTDELAALFDDHRAIKAVSMPYVDSSTAAATDVAGIARLVRSRGALVMVDAVSSLGGMPFAFDEWDIDVAVTASQKCLMSSPGLSWVALSERAWSLEPSSRLPRNYWNFSDIRRHVTRSTPETLGTPPVHIVLQVAEALRMIHEEGLPHVYARHAAMGERVRTGAAALGLAMQCPDVRQQSATMTALAAPAGTEPKRIRDAMKAQGILTAAGLGRFEADGLRIGHMGDIRMPDVERTLAALAQALHATGTAPS